MLHILGKPPSSVSRRTSQKGEGFEKESNLLSLKWYSSNPTWTRKKAFPLISCPVNGDNMKVQFPDNLACPLIFTHCLSTKETSVEKHNFVFSQNIL